MKTEILPQTGDYVCINTELGPKVRVVERRVKHPQTGDRCLLCAGVLYPLAQCHLLGWVPTGGQSVILNMPWHTAHGQQGTIIRIYSLKGMPLADVIVPGMQRCLDVQITWLIPAEADHAN
jgi:hypothetical protein